MIAINDRKLIFDTLLFLEAVIKPLSATRKEDAYIRFPSGRKDFAEDETKESPDFIDIPLGFSVSNQTVFVGILFNTLQNSESFLSGR